MRSDVNGEAPIFVTGATGNAGSAVIDALLARGLPVRAGDRVPERVRARLGERVNAVRFDFSDPSTFAAAAGCRAAFLLRPPAISQVESTLNAFVDAARARGLGHVVFLSVAGAETNALVPHHAVETHLTSRDAAWTILRPGFFAQNFGDAYREDIVLDDRIYVPAGRGSVAFVDVRDVAEVAALAFAEPEAHASRAYKLTGPAAVGFAAAAVMLGEVTGRRIRYEPASILGYARHLHARGLPAAQIAVQTVLHVGLRFGQAERVDPALRALLGHAPRSLHTYFDDHATTWAARRDVKSPDHGEARPLRPRRRDDSPGHGSPPIFRDPAAPDG